MSDSVSSVIEMFEEVAATSVTSARDSLVKPFRDVILGSFNLHQRHERPPEGRISGSKDKQYSYLLREEENYNPNLLFAPPTPPRVNKGGIKPVTPPRFHTP